jgi:hypothetical protein
MTVPSTVRKKRERPSIKSVLRMMNSANDEKLMDRKHQARGWD